jgi:hypothetical protein
MDMIQMRRFRSSPAEAPSQGCLCGGMAVDSEPKLVCQQPSQ